MGYETPNIDRLTNEGMIFTDAYAQQSCTAGRTAFMTGQVPFRTGLTKVGLPGSDLGLQPEDPTIAELLKPHGYATGQFGKNHLGDLDEHLPTNHGFDEFFGNLYHLNAEEEPEPEDYPKDPEFKRKFGPRGVIKSFVDGRVKFHGRMYFLSEALAGEITGWVEVDQDIWQIWFGVVLPRWLSRTQPRGLSGPWARQSAAPAGAANLSPILSPIRPVCSVTHQTGYTGRQPRRSASGSRSYA